MLSRVPECLEHEFAVVTRVQHALKREYAHAPPSRERLELECAPAPRVRERVERGLAVGGPVFTALAWQAPGQPRDGSRALLSSRTFEHERMRSLHTVALVAQRMVGWLHPRNPTARPSARFATGVNAYAVGEETLHSLLELTTTSGTSTSLLSSMSSSALAMTVR
jgi:hypothetical protein